MITANDARKRINSIEEIRRNNIRGAMEDFIYMHADWGATTAFISASCVADWLREELIEHGFIVSYDEETDKYCISWGEEG